MYFYRQQKRKAMKMKYLVGLILVLGLTACQTQKPIIEKEVQLEETTQEVGKIDRLIGKWVLEYMSPVLGKDVKQLFKIQKPYLTFVDETKVAGNNGCNNVAGEYEVKGNQILFFTEQFRSTRMFCEGVDETVFVNGLKTINGFDVIDQGNKLILLTGDIVSMSFVKVEQ